MRHPVQPYILQYVRMLPFICFSVASLWWTARAPVGRKPFSFDADVSYAALERAMGKIHHIESMAFLCLLALLAFGYDRLLLAMMLTLAVGFGWELAQTTVVGHHARLADLLPDMIGIIAAVGAALVGRALWQRL